MNYPARWMSLALLVGVVLSCLAAPATADDDERDELRKRFKERFAQLVELKDDGKVGEVYTGYVDLVKAEYGSEKLNPDKEDSPTIKEFIAAENTDRRKLYALLAKELKVDPKTIAERNAVRLFENAHQDWFLKPEGRDWIKKKFKERFAQLVQLKDDGKVGEVYTGYVDLVKAEYGSEKLNPDEEDSPTIKEFIAAANTDRRKLYALLAEELKVDPKTTAERIAVRTFENAKPDWFLKPEGRDWIKKKDLDKEEEESE